MVQICYLCKNGEVVLDKKTSSSYCTGCGECFDFGAFTDELQYREDDRGRYTSLGTAFHLDKGFVNCKFSTHSQFLASVDNAKSILKRYCEKLSISESYAQISVGFYQQLLIHKYMNGRRLNVVLAACLYVAVRTEGAQVILLDISDVAEANVYDIGRYYFQISHLLHTNIHTVDPSEYTLRFVEMLNLGERSNAQVKYTEARIRETANRLVQRMKRDWIHYGRRPSGVCAAAVLVAARINNVHCRIKDIISIAKVCESTIRKRLSEFVETAASQLTYNEFMSTETSLENNLNEEDPPAYKASIKEAVDANIYKVEKYKQIIEPRLKESRSKAKGLYAKFLKDIFTENEAESLVDDQTPNVDVSDNKLINQVLIEQNISIIDEKISKEDELIESNAEEDPLDYNLNYWANLRPTAKSLGLTKKDRIDDDESKDYEKLLNMDLSEEMNEEEIDSYIIKDEVEINQRNLQWNQLYKDYLIKEQEKESAKILQDKDNSEKLNNSSENTNNNNNSGNSNKQRKRRRKDNDDLVVEAATASEAVESVCKKKMRSLNGINLKKLFNEEVDDASENISLEVEEPTVDLEYQPDPTMENGEEDAQLVNLYHSYAVQSTLP